MKQGDHNGNRKEGLLAALFIPAFLITVLLIPLALIQSSLAQPLQDSMGRVDTIVSTVGQLSQIGTSSADYYYMDEACKESFESVVGKFQGHVTQGIVKEVSLSAARKRVESLVGIVPLLDSLPILVLKSDPPIIISGEAACSQEFLIKALCRFFPNQTACPENTFMQTKIPFSPSLLIANPCFESCTIEYQPPSSNAVIIQSLKSSACGPIPTYNELSSLVLTKSCLDTKSCISDESDAACCNANECVFRGKCYPSGSAMNVDGDAQIEICADVETSSSPKWSNPDIAKDVCDAAFHWISPDSLGLRKVHGTSEYGRDELCCGDDKGEQYTPCGASFCGEDIATCCPIGECSFEGKCYGSGCQSLTTANGKIHSYCNNGAWEDLDKNNCAECLGKKRAGELICCGDDVNEGLYPTLFSVKTPQTTYSFDYTACTNSKNNCVFPDSEKEFSQGCYDFDDNPYIDGGHYCNNARWYDLDANKRYCSKCGHTYISKSETCCGDDRKEFLVEGQDGSLGCCKRPSDEVLGGVCLSTLNCGNGKLDNLEQCDPPLMDNNPFCTQSTIKCQGKKLGYRDSKGYCDDSCLCIGDNYTYSCTKGSCGATCSSDKDCPLDHRCDKESCGCVQRLYCGDGEISEKNDEGWKEECEPPNTELNSACDFTQRCFGLRTGVQYQYGMCTRDCLCSYLPYQRLCIKGSCGAECNQDGTGCGTGQTCDINNCECMDSDASCGDGRCGINEQYICPRDCIPDPCPFKVDISLDKSYYRSNDTVAMRVQLYDSSNRLLANAPFEIDFLINQQYAETTTQSTPEDGVYKRTFKILSSLPTGNYQYVAYIAKSRNPLCDTVGDTTHAFVFVTNLGVPTNVSPFSLTYGLENTSLAACGNNQIDHGESCEGDALCRISSGCDNASRTYDISEACIFCGCPRDITSSPDDEVYCANCNACGDGEVNCNEDCEYGITERGLVCRDGQLFVQRDGCSNCTFVDDGPLNDEFANECACSCPQDPISQCSQGNYVDYPSSYLAGCKGESCNECNCDDRYTKDTNKDGIEDKCSKEMCTNGIDDDDDGKIDTLDEECSLCKFCGYGPFNTCDRNECGTFLQGCFFQSSFFNYGSCNVCAQSTTCESYGIDRTTCTLNPCNRGNCMWGQEECCTDSDGEGICDSNDNCPHAKNEDQLDGDFDGKGDACDLCPSEPALSNPSELSEESCNDGIDNDCDGLADCADSDCIGVSDCCQTASDCEDKECRSESCLGNRCISIQRSTCDGEDCPIGSYCTSEGTCSSKELSKEVCTQCTADATAGDDGVGFGQLIGYGMPCCGDSPNEYYVREDFDQGACCQNPESCIFNGDCVSKGELRELESLLCIGSRMVQCSNTTACASPNGIHTCSYDGAWAWRERIPQESCEDAVDNDCDGLGDLTDPDCQNSA